MENQQYCLKWNNFSQHLKYAFNTIWSNDDSFTDVTLAIQGGFKMRGHKMVLSACSYYFKKLLVADTSESPVLILHDVSRPELEALVHFMYHGEVNVTQEVIPGLLKAAEMLQIRGLCAAPPPSANKSSASTTSTPTSTASRPLKRIAPAPPASEPPTASPAAKKARKKAPPSAPPPLAPAPADGRGRSSVESEESRDTNGVGGGSDTEGDGQLRIDEESNGLEPETLLDEQDAEGDGWSQGSGATEDQLLYPLPRPEPDADAAPSPEGFTFSSQLRNLAVKVKLEPRVPNDLEAAIVSSMPKNARGRRRCRPLPGYVPLVVPRPLKRAFPPLQRRSPAAGAGRATQTRPRGRPPKHLPRSENPDRPSDDGGCRPSTETYPWPTSGTPLARSSSCPAPPLSGHISLPWGTTITRATCCAASPLGTHIPPSSCSTPTRSMAPVTVPPPCTYTPPPFGNTHTRLTPAPLSDAHALLYFGTTPTWSTLTPRRAPPLGNQLCPDTQSSNHNALFGVLLGPWLVLIADTTLTWCTLTPRAASPGTRLSSTSDSALPRAPPASPASPAPCTSLLPDTRTQPTAGSAKTLSLSSSAPCAVRSRVTCQSSACTTACIGSNPAPCAAVQSDAFPLSISASPPTLSVREPYAPAPSGVLGITKQTRPTPAHCSLVSTGGRPPSNSVTAPTVSVPAACPMVPSGAHTVTTSVAPQTRSSSTHRAALSGGTCPTSFTLTSPQTLNSPVRCAVYTLGTHPPSSSTSTPTRSTPCSCTSVSPRPSVRRHRRRANGERPRVLVLLSSNVRLRVTPAPAPGAWRAAMVPPSPPAPHSGPQCWTPSRAPAALHSAPNTKCMCTRKTATRTAKSRRCGKLARATLSGVSACGSECPGRPVFPGPILVPGSERTLVASP
ncbi:mucin-5AC-like isoform X2 [Amphibalanus amphitrite]|uniref:mucin-5AC-like isoform X2 n=1 Tax=Amphibalanus amphitrite TaxID=1232801 RepID=UPI001C91BB1C|nr:mucin-5AC-like isoform X2 [Amphibalanus amphitrite]